MDILHEHEKADRLAEDVFYPDHEPRTESETFRETKKAGHAAQIPCAISGHTEKTEYHHMFIEWAFSDAVDWQMVKKVALREVMDLPILDPVTDQPTGQTFPAHQSLMWVICKLAQLRGFDWEKFDPDHPEQFVDSMANMLVIHEKFHRHKDHGIHAMSFPEWIFQAWPRKKGFVFTPDEKVPG